MPTSLACWLPVAYRCLAMAWHSGIVGGRGGCGGTWTSSGSTVALNGRPVDVGSSVTSAVSELLQLCLPLTADDDDSTVPFFVFLSQNVIRHNYRRLMTELQGWWKYLDCRANMRRFERQKWPTSILHNILALLQCLIDSAASKLVLVDINDKLWRPNISRFRIYSPV